VIDCGLPVWDEIAVAVSVHVPAVRNETTPDATVHTLAVDEVTYVVPVAVPEYVGVNVAPTTPLIAGMFEIVTVAVGGVADAGVATAPRPATLIAKTATTATPRGIRRLNPRRLVEAEISNIMMTPVRDAELEAVVRST
jgi:hypothetical protein